MDFAPLRPTFGAVAMGGGQGLRSVVLLLHPVIPKLVVSIKGQEAWAPRVEAHRVASPPPPQLIPSLEENNCCSTCSLPPLISQQSPQARLNSARRHATPRDAELQCDSPAAAPYRFFCAAAPPPYTLLMWHCVVPLPLHLLLRHRVAIQPLLCRRGGLLSPRSSNPSRGSLLIDGQSREDWGNWCEMTNCSSVTGRMGTSAPLSWTSTPALFDSQLRRWLMLICRIRHRQQGGASISQFFPMSC